MVRHAEVPGGAAGETDAYWTRWRGEIQAIKRAWESDKTGKIFERYMQSVFTRERDFEGRPVAAWRPRWRTHPIEAPRFWRDILLAEGVARGWEPWMSPSEIRSYLRRMAHPLRKELYARVRAARRCGTPYIDLLASIERFLLVTEPEEVQETEGLLAAVRCPDGVWRQETDQRTILPE